MYIFRRPKLGWLGATSESITNQIDEWENHPLGFQFDGGSTHAFFIASN